MSNHLSCLRHTSEIASNWNSGYSVTLVFRDRKIMQSINSKTIWAMKLNTQKGDFMKIFVVLFSIVNTDFLLDVQNLLQSILPKHIRLSLITKGFFFFFFVKYCLTHHHFTHVSTLNVVAQFLSWNNSAKQIHFDTNSSMYVRKEKEKKPVASLN